MKVEVFLPKDILFEREVPTKLAGRGSRFFSKGVPGIHTYVTTRKRGLVQKILVGKPYIASCNGKFSVYKFFLFAYWVALASRAFGDLARPFRAFLVLRDRDEITGSYVEVKGGKVYINRKPVRIPARVVSWFVDVYGDLIEDVRKLYDVQ